MKRIDDGGPAFPSPEVYSPNGQYQHGEWGMSLRDVFAGQALVGILSSDGCPEGDDAKAQWAYDLADAMLKARWNKAKEEKP